MKESISERNFSEAVISLLGDNVLGMRIFLEIFAQKEKKECSGK